MNEMKLAKRKSNEFFSANLRKIVKKKGLSGCQLALKLGVDRQRVHHWLNGDNLPDLIGICKLCIALDITPNDLLPNSVISKSLK